MKSLLKTFSERKEILRLLRFCAVGASGVLVNMAVFAICIDIVLIDVSEGSRNVLATSTAVLFSILTNFLLNDAWTWRDRRRGPMAARLLKYYIVAGIAGLMQVGVQFALSVQLAVDGYLANMAGIAVGVAINFFINNLWTFRTGQDPLADGAEAVDEAPGGGNRADGGGHDSRLRQSQGLQATGRRVHGALSGAEVGP